MQPGRICYLCGCMPDSRGPTQSFPTCPLPLLARQQRADRPFPHAPAAAASSDGTLCWQSPCPWWWGKLSGRGCATAWAPPQSAVPGPSALQSRQGQHSMKLRSAILHTHKGLLVTAAWLRQHGRSCKAAVGVRMYHRQPPTALRQVNSQPCRAGRGQCDVACS